MKKRKSDKPSGSTDGPTRPPRDGKLRAAIESVFRFTHGREMTVDERRVFGLTGEDGAKVDRRSSPSHRSSDGS